LTRTTKGNTARLSGTESTPGALRDQSAFLLGQGGKQMQNERVHFWAKLSDQERHAVSH
jgi:hypothetical protein